MRILKITSVLTPVLLVAFYTLRLLPMLPFFPKPQRTAGPVGQIVWYQSLSENVQFLLMTLSVMTVLVAVAAVASLMINIVIRKKQSIWYGWIVVYLLLEIPIIFFLIFSLLKL